MHHTFPTRHTPRFVLRQLVASDLARVFAALSHPEVIRHYGMSYDTEEACQAQMDWFAQIWQEKTGLWWAICPQHQPDLLIGAAGVYALDPQDRHAELGYWLLPDFWRTGVMSECLPVVIAAAFESLPIHRLSADVEPDNLASSALLRKNRFQLEGVRRECEWHDDHWRSIEQYARLRTD